MLCFIARCDPVEKKNPGPEISGPGFLYAAKVSGRLFVFR
jgi:hypothetical protein